MKEKFNPLDSTFKTVADLPTDQQNKFTDVKDGLVKNTAAKLSENKNIKDIQTDAIRINNGVDKLRNEGSRATNNNLAKEVITDINVAQTYNDKIEEDRLREAGRRFGSSAHLHYSTEIPRKPKKISRF